MYLRLPLLLLACCALQAADPAEPSVRWGGGTSPNMISPARNLPADPGQARPLWEVKLGSHQYSIPTIDRGRIYIGGDDARMVRAGYKPSGGGVVMCVDQATGKLIWQLFSPRFMEGVKPPFHFDQWRCGICSGPVVDGDRVYVVGNRGDVLCLDRDGQANGNEGPFLEELEYMGIARTPDARLEPADGDIVWRYNLLTELKVIPHDVCGSTILLSGDFLYVCTSNGQDDRHEKIPNPLAPNLIVLDKKTGKLVAKDDEKIGERTLHCNWSSPSAGIVNGKTLIFFGAGDGMLYAFEPPRPSAEGAGVQLLKKVWSFDCNPPEFRVRDGKPVPYSKHNKNSTEGPSEVIGTPVFQDGRVYVVIGQSPVHGNGRGCLSCVDAATGAKVWTSELIERSLATPAIADGLVYIPDTTGNLHCFDAATGQRYWMHPLEAKCWGSSAFVADGKVYVGTEASVLWVLKTGKEKQVLARTQLLTVPITLAAVDGVLYIPTQRSLVALAGTETTKSPAP
jgi:outer membrane protein assembly factor BamB